MIKSKTRVSSIQMSAESKFEVLYIVTQYGCNSTPSEMRPPETDVFTDYEKAYKRFLGVSPDLDDEDNRAERTVHTIDIGKEKIVEGYTLIESRVQVPGYYDGDGSCAKRPEGAVIARLVKKRENVKALIHKALTQPLNVSSLHVSKSPNEKYKIGC